MRARPWEYIFFVDLAGHREDPKVKRALEALEREALFLKVLGSYPEGRSGGRLARPLDSLPIQNMIT